MLREQDDVQTLDLQYPLQLMIWQAALNMVKHNRKIDEIASVQVEDFRIRIFSDVVHYCVPVVETLEANVVTRWGR